MSGDDLVTLIYHKKLAEEWTEAVESMRQRLGVSIVGRSRSQKVLLDRDWVIEKLPVNGRQLIYKQVLHRNLTLCILTIYSD
jgi:tRNA (uracil-5-)-methyltransferase